MTRKDTTHNPAAASAPDHNPGPKQLQGSVVLGTDRKQQVVEGHCPVRQCGLLCQ